MDPNEPNPLLDALKSKDDQGPGFWDEAREKVEYQEDGNRATANSSSVRIKTVEELIEACKIDLSIWEIDRWLVNKWEGYRSGKVTNLEYEGGLASGQIEDSGRLWIEPLFQVKVWLVKKEPVPIRPVVSPVIVKLGKTRRARRQSCGDVKRGLMIADPHFGFERRMDGQLVSFHDEMALDVVLQLLDLENFDVTVIAGDAIDLAEWTDKYVRTPEHYWTTQAAVNRAAEFIAQLKQRYERVVVMEGNHDERLEKMLVVHFLHAYDLRPADRLEEAPPMSVPNLLGLERMGVEYIGDYPNGVFMLNEMVGIEHGNVVRQNPGHSASEVVRKSTITRGFGHIHRREMASRRVADLDRTISAFSPGCLCRIGGVVPGSKRDDNWQQGFAEIEYLESGEHSVAIYPIENGRTIYRGLVLEARTDERERGA